MNVPQTIVFDQTAEEKAAELKQLREFWVWASPRTIEDNIEEIVAEEHTISRDEVHDDLDFWKDLDDSLDFVELIMRCEEELSFEFPDENVAAENINTVRDLKNYILRKLGKTT